ncbi:MAG: OmpA family protein [Pseudomonadota bacterium]|nr:OmpA family protein [Pseudomonadota bacterium]
MAATLVSCGKGSNAAVVPPSINTSVEILDQAALAELNSSFLTVSGSDRVAFAEGSAELTPKARFQLERQALWLEAHEYVAIRFRSVSASAKDVSARRLAHRRAEAVRAYLEEFGVKAGQFVGIDVEFGRAGTVTTVIDPFHFGYPAARRATIETGQGKS